MASISSDAVSDTLAFANASRSTWQMGLLGTAASCFAHRFIAADVVVLVIAADVVVLGQEGENRISCLIPV